MAIDRDGTYSHTSSPAPTGLDFLEQYGAYMDALIDTATLRLVSVAGTANAITASSEPFELPSTGLSIGMKFTFQAAANNTGAVTINIDGSGAVSILNSDRSALTADSLVTGTQYLIEFDGTNFVVLGNSSANGGGSSGSRTVYDSTFVWNNNVSSDTLVTVELWGAGGGGSGNFGGGGGAYATKTWLAGDLPSTVTVTVPAGGAEDTDGGDCTFGTLLTAYGGGSGADEVDALGGGGGGELEAGSGTTPGAIGGGSGADATSIYGGAGGSRGNGYGAVYGGGGGGGVDGPGTGGTSAYGGNGGTDGSAGQRPGGGGGRNAAGGAGRCIITTR